MIFLELLYEKKKFPLDFLNDEKEADSYFFLQFIGHYVVQNKVLRLSKGLLRETYSIKEFTYEPSTEYQSLELTAEKHLTRKKNNLSRKVGLIKKSYDSV